MIPVPDCLIVENTNLINNNNQIQVAVTVENRCSDVQNGNLQFSISNFGSIVETRVLNLGNLSPGHSRSERLTLDSNTYLVVNNGLSRGHLTYCYGNEICSQTPNFIRFSFFR